MLGTFVYNSGRPLRYHRNDNVVVFRYYKQGGRKARGERGKQGRGTRETLITRPRAREEWGYENPLGI